MSKKLTIGIDINEILRAKWLQFDRFYDQEFGNSEIETQPKYEYDLFGKYKWEDKVEIEKELKEPEDFPEDINPLDYQIDEKTGEAPADFALFKNPKEVHLTAKEVYNRFMYEDFVFEIHGSAPKMYPNLDLDVKNFFFKYKDTVDFIVVSKENYFSIPSTLFFLSKITSRFTKYHFCETNDEMWEGINVLITTDPEILDAYKDTDNMIVKLTRPYNEDCYKGSITPVLQINDLNGNEEFEKLINYIKPTIQ
jgi:hypothetical protein